MKIQSISKEMIVILTVFVALSYVAVDLFNNRKPPSRFIENGAQRIDTAVEGMRSRCEVPFYDIGKRIQMEKQPNSIK